MLLKLALGNVRKSARDFAIYFVTVLLGVAVFYAFNSACDQQAVSTIGDTSKMRELLGLIIRYVSVFIAAVLAFLIIYANGFLMRRRSKEFGLYLTLGMGVPSVLAIVGLETLLTGLASLVGGLVLGYGFSWALTWGTAQLFQEEISGFAMGISWDALGLTLGVFAAIFFLAALINSRRIAATPLLDLLHADRKNQPLVLRSLPLSVGLFLLAIVCIGYSYHLLVQNGLLEPNLEFLGATLLVCVGTGLFFFSLSGFLLRIVQWIRPLYYRGLSMFTLRSLNAKLNTTVASMTVVCIALFLSLTSVCCGVGIVNAMDNSLEDLTRYDGSVRTSWMSQKEIKEAVEAGPEFNKSSAYKSLGAFADFAKDCNYAMAYGLELSAEHIGSENLAAIIDETAQINRYVNLQSPLAFKDFEALVPRSLSECLGPAMEAEAQDILIETLKLSEVNSALALAGEEPLKLQENQGLLIYNSAFMADFWRQFESGDYSLPMKDKSVAIKGVINQALETVAVPLDTGSLILPDSAFGDDALAVASVLDVKLKTSDDQNPFSQILESIYDSDNPDTWPITMVTTRDAVYAQTSGITGLVAFLAIYIGFILTVTCAAILAIQQLTEASDNTKRYGLLRKLGTPESMISLSLLTQIAVYFLAPLLLALAHSACAVSVVSTVIAIFGNLDISQTALFTAGSFLTIYGVYFLATFLIARKLSG